MEKLLQCECGFVARAECDEDLAVQIRRHAWDAHRMTLSFEEALLLASRGSGPVAAAGSPSAVSAKQHRAAADSPDAQPPAAPALSQPIEREATSGKE